MRLAGQLVELRREILEQILQRLAVTGCRVLDQMVEHKRVLGGMACKLDGGCRHDRVLLCCLDTDYTTGRIDTSHQWLYL